MQNSVLEDTNDGFTNIRFQYAEDLVFANAIFDNVSWIYIVTGLTYVNFEIFVALFNVK